MSTTILNVAEEFSKVRLDVYLTKNLTDVPSRNFVQTLIENGAVKVNGQQVKVNHKLAAGDVVDVKMLEGLTQEQDIAAENIPLDIFYEDDLLIVVNKPPGMMVHPATGCYTGTLVNALLYHCKNLSDFNSFIRPGIVHRLDKETSGLIVAAKDNKTHAFLARQFQSHQVKKRYVALVQGRVEFDQGKIDVSLGRHPTQREKKAVRFDDDAKDAVTFYEVLKRVPDKTFVALFPQTGRTHQLRVHMKHLGHPILGDDKYGRKDTFPRLALHAQSLGFEHPHTRQYVEFSSVVPAEFLDAVGGRSPDEIAKLLNN